MLNKCCKLVLLGCVLRVLIAYYHLNWNKDIVWREIMVYTLTCPNYNNVADYHDFYFITS